MNSSLSSTSMYGCAPMTATLGPAAVTQHMATTGDGLSGLSALVHPDNPLVWVGILLAATVGLGSLAGRVRLGPASAALNLGKG